MVYCRSFGRDGRLRCRSWCSLLQRLLRCFDNLWFLRYDLVLIVALVCGHDDILCRLLDGSRVACSNLCIAVGPDVRLRGRLVDVEELLELGVLLCLLPLALQGAVFFRRWEMFVALGCRLLDLDLPS